MRVACWLLPDNKSQTNLSKIISRLSAEYKGPSFSPHVTLGVGVCNNPSEFINAIKTTEFSAQTRGIDFGSSYTKCCFIRLVNNSLLSSLAESVADKLQNGSQYSFDPHLSLFYGKLLTDQKSQIQDFSDIPAEIRFTEISLVRISEVNNTAKDIESWEEILRLAL